MQFLNAYYCSANGRLEAEPRVYPLRKLNKQLSKKNKKTTNFNICFDPRDRSLTSMESIEVNDPDILTDIIISADYD